MSSVKENNALPSFLYGTAWKEDKTKELTELALQNNFRAIDTANQRKHYWEAEVGKGLISAYESLSIKRSDVFLQTKFTFIDGQDHRLPYDPKANISAQVEQSFNSSLHNLHTDYLDSYILHGPAFARGLHDADWQAWQTMEKLHQTGSIKHIGVSNFNFDQLELLCKHASIKPKFIQNRCFADMQWDKNIREFCAVNNMVYQGFSLLTANRLYLQHPIVQEIAVQSRLAVPQLIFSFAKQIGILPLTGTSNAEHMKLDLNTYILEKRSVELLENIANAKN